MLGELDELLANFFLGELEYFPQHEWDMVDK